MCDAPSVDIQGSFWYIGAAKSEFISCLRYGAGESQAGKENLMSLSGKQLGKNRILAPLTQKSVLAIASAVILMVLVGLATWVIRNQMDHGKYDTSFPLPDDMQNFTKALKSDRINFETNLSLKEITNFYRRAFAEQELTERKLLTVITDDFLQLVFEGLPNGKICVVQVIDLGYSSNKDMRNVGLRTEDNR